MIERQKEKEPQQRYPWQEMTIEEVRDEVDEIISVNNLRHYKEGLYEDDDYINWLEDFDNIRITIVK
tara:strand:- start:229 stop:429 length:201 start_codon:yes stop_codon:yes gene_type:complete